jgi:hypothetical protein
MRSRPLLFLIALFAAAFFFLAYPVFVIRPFRYQGPRELAVALHIFRYRPALEAICAVLALVILTIAWHRVSGIRKLALILFAALIVGCGLMSRINIYEKMFHPLDHPTFSSAAQSRLDPGEQVIAVIVHNAARAYPIRSMSYHHIVNDTLGGRAIVATY